MAFLLGTDEAGYGPNLGPLTIGSTLWQVPNEAVDLYEAFETVLSSSRDPSRLMVADSKQVYSSGQSLRDLETSVLSFLLTLSSEVPTNFGQLADAMGFDLAGLDHSFPSIAEFKLPVSALPRDIESNARRLVDIFDETGCRLQAMQTVAVFPERFNEMVCRLGNKAELLSSETLLLAGRMLDKRPDGDVSDVSIGCDKHGGRSKYAGMLNQYLTREFVHVVKESLETSQYSWQQGEANVSIRFNAQGEAWMPIALSSMMAKYVREIAMLVWNEFWQEKLPGIKPTKGYPMDARRFKKEIADLQQSLGIQDQQIWRSR